MPAKTLQIPTPDGLADAFAAFPDSGDRHPGVLMYPDGFGMRPVLREMATELAEHGYYVLVPNIFYRHGPTPVLELPERITAETRPALFERLMPMIKEHSSERVLRDADAYLALLGARVEVAPGMVAAIGYCIGGRLALQTAAARPDRVAALAEFHGPVIADTPEELPGLLAAVGGEAYFGHAESDYTAESLAELDAALGAAGIAYTSEVYPGTVHGFTMADSDAFDAAALGMHWERLLALLGRSLGAG